MKLQNSQAAKEFLTTEGASALFSGHPWIWRSQVKDPEGLPKSPGLAHLGEHWFFYSPLSKIALRRIGPRTRNWAWNESDRRSSGFTFFGDKESPETHQFWSDFFDFTDQLLSWKIKARIQTSDECFRWIFAETDGIPGLVIDVFRNQVVAIPQISGIELFWEKIKEQFTSALQMLWLKPEQNFDEKNVYWLELRNHPFRKTEGLQIFDEPNQSAPLPQYVRWNGLDWHMSPGGGQKTGNYLDQGLAHRATAEWARRLGLKNFWDVCCFEGGFGLHLIKDNCQGTFVDSSAKALAVTQTNLDKNFPSPAFGTKPELIQQDAFEFLKQREVKFRDLDFNAAQRPQLITLDPPSFAKKKSDLPSACRGLKELNLRAIKALQRGGLLTTCSCSHVVSKQIFESVLREAAHDARREVRVLEVKGPSPDHSPHLGFPEGDYLQSWILGIV